MVSGFFRFYTGTVHSVWSTKHIEQPTHFISDLELHGDCASQPNRSLTKVGQWVVGQLGVLELGGSGRWRALLSRPPTSCPGPDPVPPGDKGNPCTSTPPCTASHCPRGREELRGIRRWRSGLDKEAWGGHRGIPTGGQKEDHEWVTTAVDHQGHSATSRIQQKK